MTDLPPTDPRTPRSLADGVDAALTLHEEQLEIYAHEVDAGAVRARKTVDDHSVSIPVEHRVEQLLEGERVAADEHDSGRVETLADGSISIPILEEELVVTKRVVVRERVILRKQVVTETRQVEASLRRERLDIDGEGCGRHLGDGEPHR